MRAEFLEAIQFIEKANAEARYGQAVFARLRNNIDNKSDDAGSTIDDLLDRETKLQKIMNALYEARIEMKEYLEGNYK